MLKQGEAGTIHLFDVRDTPVFVHWSLLAGVVVISIFARFDLVATLALSLGYFLLVLSHEAAHALAARALGLRVFSILVQGDGGLCRFEQPSSYRGAFLVVSAGLLAQCLLLVLATACIRIFGAPGSNFGSNFMNAFTYLNLFLIVTNVIPMKPRDLHFASDGYLLWKLAIGALQGKPFSMPDTSATFVPGTRLAKLKGFMPKDFVTGVEILNDNTTPMDFVVRMLTTHLKMPEEKSIELMLYIHLNGGLMIPTPTYEDAMVAVGGITRDSLSNGHPLVCRAVDTRG